MTGVALIPKEKEATTISQFPTISLLHVEGKILFGVIAERMAECLQRKAYAATSIEKILAYLVPAMIHSSLSTGIIPSAFKTAAVTPQNLIQI